MLVRLGVDGLAIPCLRLEGEPDPGVAGSGVALVDGQDVPERRGVEGDASLLPGLADGRADDALAFFQVSGRRSARVP
jgi:hypothetical protein